jgi:diguanylate cyclase (GGDEF)-like protein
MREQQSPGFWNKYARVIEMASIALILLGLSTTFAIRHDSLSQMRDILILAGIAVAYMLAYFHLALPRFGDTNWLQITNVILTVILLAGFQHITHLTAQIALLLMLVVCVTGLRLGLAASLVTGVFSALLSLAAMALDAPLTPGAGFFAGFQLVVYMLAGYLSTQLADTLSYQTEETIQRNRNLGLLLEMSAIGNSLELDETLPEMAAKIVNGLSASFCSIHLLEQDNRILVTSAAYSSRKEDDIDSIIGRTRAVSKVPWHRKAIETQQVMLFRQDKPYMRIRPEENLEMLLPGIQSACLIPLVFGEQVLGVISVGERRNWERERFDDLKLDLLVSIGAQAAVVVNNARLHQSIRKQVKRMEVLHEVTRALTSTIEMNSLMEIMYQQLNRVIAAETYFLGLHDEGDDVIDLRVIIDEGQRFPSYRVPYGPGFTSHVIRTRKPLLIRHLSLEKDDLPVRGIQLGREKLSESWLGVPILVNQAVTGVLVIASYTPNAFQEDDVALLTSMAGQAALALNNARRHAEVEEQSRRDSLTGVYNHSYFVQRLNQEVERALESNAPLSLIMLDIDFFKKYNDTYGHVTGDQVLRIMVQAIQAHIRPTDPVGRWGGEEFAIALPGCNLENACKVASGIRQTLSDLPIVVNEHSVPSPTVSQGIATLPQHAPNASQLVDVADRALYEAKKQGRDQIYPATICRSMTG